ncbi:MAG: type IV toxin-antitoxin system AbiEi family antitoxin [Elusimicrobiota bacterium]
MYNYVLDYIENLQSKGRYSFALHEIIDKFNKKHSAIRMALFRLAKRKKVISVINGFYVIIPPEYSTNGILSPYLFIDDLMGYLKRRYYLGLLTAAVFHGSSHQQPQELYVVTSKPSMRMINVNNLKINFISKNSGNIKGLEERKTDSGYIKISGPVLTAVDLLQLNKYVGGLNRVVEIIGDMTSKFDKHEITKLGPGDVPLSVVQRLGYILETILRKKTVADLVWKAYGKRINRSIALNPMNKSAEFKRNNRWKIIVNESLESEK